MRNAASSLDPRVGDVIVCPRIEGHRLSYVRLLVARAVECGRSVEVLAPAGTGESPEYSLHLGAHRADVRLREMDAFTAPTLQRIFEEQPQATFIFPDGDDVVRLLAIQKLRPAGTSVSVLSMRPRGQSQWYAKRCVETAAKALIRWIAGLHRVSRSSHLFQVRPPRLPLERYEIPSSSPRESQCPPGVRMTRPGCGSQSSVR